MNAHAKNLSFLYHVRQVRLAPFYDLLCTDMYEGLTKRLAIKIGRKNRPGWIKARHWEGLAADVKIGTAVLKKQLSGFCRQCAVTVDSTYLKFTRDYGHHQLVEDIVMAIKKRSVRTLGQFE